MGAVDNVDKCAAQRASSDKEAVDVRLRVQVAAVGGCGRATVQDAGLLCNGGRNVLGQPFADVGMSFLGLRRGGSDSCSDSPYRLVGYRKMLLKQFKIVISAFKVDNLSSHQ